MDTNDPPIMTLTEVADYLRIPKASVYKLAQQGRIPCQKVGKHWRFRRAAVDEWLSPGPQRNPESQAGQGIHMKRPRRRTGRSAGSGRTRAHG